MEKYPAHKIVQSIAKETMQYLASVILPGISEIEIKRKAETYMMQHGIESFWYYDIGAFVFAGERTVLSLSGKEYAASEQKVEPNDIVTVDLSPCVQNIWGDYARTFLVGNINLQHGIEFEKYLHEYLIQLVSPEITFHEIFHEIKKEIETGGYRNADFNCNLGHTIEDAKEKRTYIEHNNMLKVKDAGLFTFEPHILKGNEPYGFKMENIYYIEDNTLKEL